MTQKPTETLAAIGELLTGLYATYTDATATARDALIAAAVLVFDIDSNATAFLSNDGKELKGKKLTNARGAWFSGIGLEAWFVNLARSHGNAVDLMGADWVARQSVETIKRIAPEVSAKHKVKGKNKLRPKADRRKAVKARLVAAQVVADKRGADTFSGADITNSRNNPRGDDAATVYTLADLVAYAAKVTVTETGTITLEEWNGFVAFVDTATSFVADKLSKAVVTDDADTDADDAETADLEAAQG